MSTDLTKLTVPQLRALCKDRGITGYSKIAKGALIQKLNEHASIATTSDTKGNGPRSTPLPSGSLGAVEVSKPASSFPERENPLGTRSVELVLPNAEYDLAEARSCLPTNVEGKACQPNMFLRDESPLTGEDQTVDSVVNPAISPSTSGPAIFAPRSASDRQRDRPDEPATLFKDANKTGASSDEGSKLSPGTSNLDSTSSSVAVVSQARTMPSNGILTSDRKRRVPRPEKTAATTGRPTKRKKVIEGAAGQLEHTAAAATAGTSSEIFALSLPTESRPCASDSSRHGVPIEPNAIFVPRTATAQASQPESSIYSASTCNVPSSARAEEMSAFSSNGLGTTRTPSSLNEAGTSSAGLSDIMPGSRTTTRLLKTPARKFKPLVVKKLGSDSINPSTLRISTAAMDACHTAIRPYFDLLALPPINLVPITLPPSLSQRKHVHKWAIILSGLSDEDRKHCMLVSKMFRYAVHLSAAHILSQEFGGARTDKIMQKFPKVMINMWPYLHQRQRECSHWRGIYERSFMTTFYEELGFVPISEKLWTSPDDEKQVLIAMRFVLTRLWFALSTGKKHAFSWLRQIVISTSEIVKDEIWSVTVLPQIAMATTARQTETFYVLESTCEVVGRPPAYTYPGEALTRETVPSMPVRADWSAYISGRLASKSDVPTGCESLMHRLTWANYEEYDRGISRLWLQRVETEGDTGKLKRTVAERYVLACIAGNSFSGQWKSTTQMAQDFAGLPDPAIPPMRSRSKAQEVNLFLPAHHHIESVHFTARDGQPLHAAVAVVQTPGREYYILRENGMQVGCEEDGVGELWMEVLKCDANGRALV